MKPEVEGVGISATALKVDMGGGWGACLEAECHRAPYLSLRGEPSAQIPGLLVLDPRGQLASPSVNSQLQCLVLFAWAAGHAEVKLAFS